MIQGFPKPTKQPKNKGLRKWLAFRAKWLKTQPTDWIGRYTCNGCGNLTEYPEVDHIVKRSVAKDRVYDETNLQILCNGCHDRKHN